MVSKFPENGDFDSSGFLFFLYYWRKPLIVITLVAIFASVLFSSPWFITPKYKSTVILFPVATNSISKALISQQSGIKEDVLGFGEEEQAEQMLQILNSNMIRDRVVKKLSDRGYSVLGQDPQLVIKAKDMVTRIPEIYNLLGSEGLEITRMQMRENTLEDVFIHLTGRGLRQ